MFPLLPSRCRFLRALLAVGLLWTAAPSVAGSTPTGSLATLSPDGAHAAWIRWHDHGPNDLMLTDTRTGEELRLGAVGGRWPDFLDDEHVVVCTKVQCEVFDLEGGREAIELGDDAFWGVRGEEVLLRQDHPEGMALVRADDRDGDPVWVGPLRDYLIWQEDAVVGSVEIVRWKRGPGYRKFTRVYLGETEILSVWHDNSRPKLFTVAPSGWAGEEGGIYVVEPDRERPPALVRYDVESGERTEIFRPERGAILRLLQDETGAVIAVATSGIVTAWHRIADHPWVDRMLALEARFGDVRLLKRSRDDQTWLVRVESDVLPPHDRVVHYDTDPPTTVPVGAPADFGEITSPRPMRVGRYQSGAYDIDVLAAAPDPGRFPEPWPVVVSVHGGPWSGWVSSGWDAWTQRLVSEGYLVVAPNFRGSAYVTPAFQDQPATAWLTGMIDDIVGAVDWAAEHGGDRERVAFVGHSYGGTAVIGIAVHHPEVPACGVAVSAMAETRCGLAHGRLAHCFQGRDFRRRSPMLALDQLYSPLLLLHGDADWITPLAPVRRFAEKADRLGVGPVELHVWEGVDHSWNDEAWAEAEVLERDFLRSCLTPEAAP